MSAAPLCPECEHRMVDGHIGETLLWACAWCGVTSHRGGAISSGALLILELTAPSRLVDEDAS